MTFDEYLKETLENDPGLKKEYDALPSPPLIQLRTNPSVSEDADGMLRFTEKIHAECVDMADRVILEEIRRTAKEAGITLLFLLDKKFVVNALKKAIEEYEKGREQ